MKVLLVTLACVLGAFSMPVGVEQDNPRPVVPLVITDYSSVANKNVGEEAPVDAPKETAVAADETRKEEEVQPAETNSELVPAIPEADSKPEAAEPKPAEQESAVKSQEPVAEAQDTVKNEEKPAEEVQNVPVSEEKVNEESALKSDVPVKDEVKIDEPVAASETSEVKSDAPANVELGSTQEFAKPVEEKVNEETKVSDVAAPVVPNAPDVSQDSVPEKAEESVEPKPVVDDIKEVKPEESAEKKIQTDEVKKESASAEAVSNVPILDPVVQEDKPAEEVKPIVPEIVKDDVPVPAKEEKVETPVNRRRRETIEKKEDEKKKKKEDEKKTKSDDIVKNVEAPISVDESVSATENKPVQVPTPVQDVPEVDTTKLKESEKVEVEKKPDSVEAVKDEVAGSVPAVVVSDKVEEPLKIEENKNVESSEEKKLATPINEEKTEVAETQVAPESVEKEADKPEEIKKEDIASVEETKKESSEEKVLSDPIPVEKVPEPAPVTLNTEEKKPESVVADEKQEEKPAIQEENVPVSS